MLLAIPWSDASTSHLHKPLFFEMDLANFGQSVSFLLESPRLSSTSMKDSARVTRLTTDSADESTSNLNDIANLAGPLARTRALIDSLGDADEETLKRFLAQSKRIRPSLQLHIQTAILQRLVWVNATEALSQAAAINPQHTDDLIRAVFSEWAHVDLDEAISQALTLSRDKRLAALTGMLPERSDLSDDIRRRIARQLGHEQYATQLIIQEKLTFLVDEPGRLWNEIVDEAQKDPSQRELLVQVGKTWIARDGLGVLDKIITSMHNAQMISSVATELLRFAARSDPDEAFDYALNLPNDPYNSAVFGVANEWAKSKPHDALNAVSKVVGSGLRQQLQEVVVKGWAPFDPRGVCESIDELPENVQRKATELGFQMLAEVRPQEASELVSAMAQGSMKNYAAHAVVEKWLSRDPRSTLNWVLSDPGLDSFRQELLKSVLARLSQDDPQLAMRTALQQSVADDERGAEIAVIAQLAITDIEKAIEFMPQVRAGQTKTEAYRLIGWGLVRRGATATALKLLKEVPDNATERYLGAVFGAWREYNPIGLYESLDELSPAVASTAAMALLSHGKWHKHLSEKQVESVREYLTEEDASQLEVLNAEGELYPRFFHRW